MKLTWQSGWQAPELMEAEETVTEADPDPPACWGFRWGYRERTREL